jgi:CubicO group peptidase (beta-lactamase class C family)
MKLFKPVLALILLCITCHSSHAQAVRKYNKETQAKIKQVEEGLCGWFTTGNDPKWTIADRMAAYNIKGVSIAVVNDYKIDWVKGYGFADEALQIPVDETTLFQAASISKSLNAMGVLKLAQQNKLNLNIDINAILKSWQFPYDSLSKNKKITLLNLLSHSAGLSGHGFPGYAVTEARPGLTDILDGRAPSNTDAIQSLFEPGLKFKYSGGGTTITQLIVTDVSGLPYETYMMKNVLKPIGMLNSSFAQPPVAPAKKLATGYTLEGKEIEGKYHIYPEQAAAGLWTTPADVARFVIEVQRSFRGKSNKVLSQEMTQKMLTPVYDANVALGTFITDEDGTKYFSHSGSNEGFMSHYFGSLDGGNGVIVMVNSDNASIIQLIANSVAKAYNWKGFYKPVQKVAVNIPQHLLDKYIGEYENYQAAYTVVKHDGQLWMVVPTGIRKMIFTSNNDFFMYEGKNSPTFITDRAGKVEGIKFTESFYMKKVR